MSILSTLRRWLTARRLPIAPGQPSPEAEIPARVQRDPLPDCVAAEAVRVTHFFNDSGRKTGTNDYSEWSDRLVSIVDKDGVEHEVDFGPDDWVEVNPGLWYRNATSMSEIVVALDQLPVTLRSRHYHWTGDQDGGTDYSSSGIREIVFSG